MSHGDRSLQELLPWLVPVNDRVVACKDSGLLACFEYRGLDTDGTADAAVAQLENLVDTAMDTWRNQPVTIWWTLRRERTTDYPGARMPTAVGQMIDDEHRARFLEAGGYVNRCFVSVLWVPERSTNAVMDRIGAYMSDGANPISAIFSGVRSALSSRHAFAWGAAELEQALEVFEGRLTRFAGTLNVLRPKRLTGESLIGFLWGMANPGLPMVPKATPREGRYLDALLGERTLDVSRNTLQVGDEADGGIHVAAISLKEFPDAMSGGAFDALMVRPIEGVLSVAFRVAPNALVEKEIAASRRNANLTKFPIKSLVVGAFKHGEMNEDQADPAKAELVEAANEVSGELSAGRLYFGWLNVTLLYYSQDAGEVETTVSEALRSLHGSRFAGATRETAHLLSAWTVTMPGAWEECRRWYLLSRDNAADAAPVVGVMSGERWNAHYSKLMGRRQPALTVLDTDYATPFYFNFNEGQVGHAFVVGPTRSGKSIAMNFLLSQFQKYPGARTVILDRDRSCRIPTLLQGGQHIDLRAGGNVKLNPLTLLGDRKHWMFLAGWIEYLCGAHGYQVTAEDTRDIWEAIEGTAADADRANHRLMGIYNLVPPALKSQLEPWIEGRQFGDYFDHAEDSFDLSRFVCIEMGPIMQQPVLAAAVMDYVFYRTELALQPIDGQPLYPTVVYVEEASFLLQVPQFATKLVGWLKTFAKLNAGVVLTTQSPEDFAETEVKKTFAAIRDNILTSVYLPNYRALSTGLKDLYVKTFQLLPEQVERIAHAIPKKEYFIVKPGVARMTSLALSPNQVNALRSEADAQRIFDECWRDGSPGPDWQQEYLRRVAEWDAQDQQSTFTAVPAAVNQ